MHDGMPHDPIQGQGQRHDCLKATQEESTVSPARDYVLNLPLTHKYLSLTPQSPANVSNMSVKRNDIITQ